MKTGFKNPQIFQLDAQEAQDNIFKKMSANRKIKLGSDFWKLAKELIGNKIYKDYEVNYGRNGSQTSPC